MAETFFPVRTPSRGFTHDWLKSSPDREFCIRAETVASGVGKIPSGGVVGRITASGKLGWFDPTAVDGTETPIGLLYYPVDATADDVEVACIVHQVAINPLGLTWGANVTTQEQKNAALATLAEAQILARHTL